MEEGIICGVEISDLLFNDKVGRVFLEHWAILATERNGYTILNRNSSRQSKEFRDVLHWRRKVAP